nr:histidine kinase [Allomuricauda sp.]
MKAEQFEDILIYFSKSLLGKENEEEILWDLAKNCIAKLGFVDCVVYLVDNGQQALVQIAAYGPKNPKDHNLYKPVEIALGQGITGSVAVSGKPEIVPDTSKDARYIVDDDRRLSEICVPISNEDIIYGVIDCEHPKIGFFTEHHLKMLSAIASICSIKIKSVRTHKALREKQDKLLQMKEEMMELKIKALNSNLNPHFVFNTLNGIQYYVTSEDKKSALEYLSTFSKLIRFNLKNLGAETVILKEEIKMLEWYLKLQKLRYDDHFDYAINIENPVGKWDAVIPSNLIQILLENMIEEAMSSTFSKELLHILIVVLEDTVDVQISYNRNGPTMMTEQRQEYLKRYSQLEDQIRLLNSNKGYQITKQERKEQDSDSGTVTLTLPNLKTIQG